VTIVNPQGLHARPADLFVRRANQFVSAIEVVKDGYRVDGKSILSVLTLVAEQGTELAIEAKGPDAGSAIKALVELIEQGFAELETDVRDNG
jgi:phosphocarrier protein